MLKFNLPSVLLVIFFLTGIPSCDKYQCGELGKVKDYSIEDIKIKSITIKGDQIDTASFYDADSVVISLYINQIEELAEIKNQFNMNLFMNTAHACSPRLPEAIQSIEKLILTTNNEIDLNNYNFSVNDTINSMFEIKNHFRSGYISIEEYIQYPSPIEMRNEFWLKSKNTGGNNISLNLNVELTLDDGKVFYFENQRLKIK